MWSLGLIIGLITAGLIVAACALLAVIWYRAAENQDRWSIDDYKVYARIAVTVAVVTVLVTAMFTFPWEKQYHYWDDKAGVVAEIESRLLKDGDGMSEKFVVRYEGSTQEYGCEDTRCALVKPGDELTLRCMRVWEYSGTDGWDCSYVGSDHD